MRRKKIKYYNVDDLTIYIMITTILIPCLDATDLVFLFYIDQFFRRVVPQIQIDKRIIAREARRIENKFKKCNVPMLGRMPREKEEGHCRFLYC